MNPCLPILVLLTALPAVPQKSGSYEKGGSQAFLLKAGGELQALPSFEGSARRAAVADTDASGGAARAPKSAPVVSTALSLPLVPVAGVRTILEQAFTGGSAGDWSVSEVDILGQELFVHQLDGVRVRSLGIDLSEASHKSAPIWTLELDVATPRLATGTGSKLPALVKTKEPRTGGVRVIQEGKEIAQVRSVDGLQFEFPASATGTASKVSAPARLSDVLTVRIAGNDVKPWIDRVGQAMAGLEVEILDSSEAKPRSAARITFDSAQLVSLARPCGDGENVLELEFRCSGPRLRFP
jgi:hypothetical protein